MPLRWHSAWALLAGPAAMLLAGCGGGVAGPGAAQAARLSIEASATQLDTNKTTRLRAVLENGEPARVEWAVAGGDPRAGAGTISAEGVYTPPSYLTRDAVSVRVSARLAGRSGELNSADAATLTVTPGFLQPFSPGNLAMGPGGSAVISGSMTEVGGAGAIRFHLASDTAGTPAGSGAGSLSEPICVRGALDGENPAYTVCTVRYTAPAAVNGSETVYVAGTISAGNLVSPTTNWTRVLVNAAGVASTPATHQSRLAVPVAMGTSSGSNVDYDANLGQLTDCCGGTLGALLQDAAGNPYVLSNNHVFGRSDQAVAGETMIQPGLIDNGCMPYGVGPGTTPVASLTGYAVLSSPATNVDAAIARVLPGLVDAKGSILELGAKLPDGTLAAAPPGISTSGGKGEAAGLGMTVAKSGRTTGLTCGTVSALDVDVAVEYFTDCAETEHAFSKTFSHQIAVSGTNFSDAGDSGALVVDAETAEPVGLFFAGGTDTHGVEQAIASPAAEVLAELGAQVPGETGPTSYSFVGGADHPVACLNYDGGRPVATLSEALEAATLSLPERERVEGALPVAQLLVNPAAGIERVGAGVSKDRPGTGAIAVYVTANAQLASIPAFVAGVATQVLPANGDGSGMVAFPEPRAASLNQALAVKQRNAARLMRANAAIFGVGVGQSLDNGADAALVLFVDRTKFRGRLPEMLEGQRLRAVLMDRLHVTRSHGTPARHGNCEAPHWNAEREARWRLPE